MILIAVILGVCIGLCLGALGGGGSIITVPALMYLLHQPLSMAITQSLVIVGISSVVAMAAHARERHVRWRTGVCLGAIGGAAAWAGTALGRLVTVDIAMATFACLMIVVAGSLLMRSPRAQKKEPQNKFHQSLAVGAHNGSPTTEVDVDALPLETASPSRLVIAIKILLAGILIGLLTGFFGVGGGFVIVPALVIILGYSMPVAVGTSLLVITVNSVVALTARAGHDVLDWSIVLPVTIAAIIGSIAGKYATQRVSEKTLTRVFAAMLLVVAVYVGARSLGLLPQ